MMLALDNRKDGCLHHFPDALCVRQPHNATRHLMPKNQQTRHGKAGVYEIHLRLLDSDCRDFISLFTLLLLHDILVVL